MQTEKEVDRGWLSSRFKFLSIYTPSQSAGKRNIHAFDVKKQKKKKTIYFRDNCLSARVQKCCLKVDTIFGTF